MKIGFRVVDFICVGALFASVAAVSNNLRNHYQKAKERQL